MKKILLLLGLSCSVAQAATPLTNTSWIMVEPATKNAAQAPTITFTEKGINGFSGCNRYTMQPNPKGESNIATTRMMCADDQMALEAAFLKAMGNQPQFTQSLDGKFLVINEGSDDKFAFKKQAMPKEAAKQPTAVAPIPPASASLPADDGQTTFLVRRSSQPQASIEVKATPEGPWVPSNGQIANFTPDAKVAAYAIEVKANPDQSAGAPKWALSRIVFQEDKPAR
ncbi:MAG: META domain-containing protein [Neisseriaceae bacterium]|nr:META domain-containing protein [Neisseriaceae bacterium]MBP6863196.1 META domain-containing protein [Neisseriaceae bacterium]